MFPIPIVFNEEPVSLLPGWKPFSSGLGYVVARKWVRLERPEQEVKEQLIEG